MEKQLIEKAEQLLAIEGLPFCQLLL